MPKIKIKQLDERISTSGVHFGKGPERRKLCPGEVVDIPEDFEAGQYNGKSLFQAIYDTGKVEITTADVTRPLDYASAVEARLSSPNFKPANPAEAREAEKVRADVSARLMTSSKAQADEPDSPAVDTPKASTPAPAARRRGRRAKTRASNGKAASS